MSKMNTLLTQLVILGAASLSATVMMTASTATAATPAYYTVELAAPIAKTQKVIQGVVWQCEGTSCVGTKTTGRPVNVCTRLSRKLGTVAAFSMRDEALSSEELNVCNAAD